MKNLLVKTNIIALTVLSLVSCTKSDAPSYTVPTTYNFSGIDSIPAKTTLSMLAEMEIAINKGNTLGTAVSGTKIKGMFANTGGYFTDTIFSGITLNLNASPINLKDITTSPAQIYITSILDSIADNSLSAVTGSNGVAGVVSNRLMSGNGVYWRQLFTKTMMGVVIEHLITDVYLDDSLSTGTLAAKQHAWDQAFFLWNVPVNFPTNRTGVKYWGSYTSQIDSGVNKTVINNTSINSNVTLLNAFLTGRAALANNDVARAREQASIISATFEKIEAATALHELNEAKLNTGGAAAIAGNISESFGFWMALKFNTKRTIISDTQINTIAALYGTNYYNLTVTNLNAIIDAISTIYGWDSIKMYL